MGRKLGGKNSLKELKDVVGSNKHPLNDKIPKKRGRPKTNMHNEPEEKMPIIHTKVLKWIGHCPKCSISITNGDLEGKDKFICMHCGKEGKVKELVMEREIKKAASKKEYLETVNSVYQNTKEIIAIKVSKKVIIEEEEEEEEVVDDIPEIKHDDIIDAPVIKNDEDDILEEHADEE